MFTPVETSIGAILLHQATTNLLYQNGNILGASGYIRRILSTPTKETVAFIVGMGVSYLPLKTFAPQLLTAYPAVPTTLEAALVTAGIGALIGIGTRMSKGCTSGHMLCGLPRLSGSSTVAVAAFFPSAIITHHFFHPTLYTEACPDDEPCYTPVYPSASATALLIILSVLSIIAARVIPSLIQQAGAIPTSDGKKPIDLRPRAREASQFFSGFLFALGLHISQMSHPAKVASFLSFPVLRQWDPSLALVMLFGVLPSLIETQRKGFDKPPSFAEKFTLPKDAFKDADMWFVSGAVIFGVGWGMRGTCPGPAVLRAFAQPVWGAIWMSGFWLGGRLASLGRKKDTNDCGT